VLEPTYGISLVEENLYGLKKKDEKGGEVEKNISRGQSMVVF